MKITRSYTVKIDGNIGKTDFLRQQLCAVDLLSSFIYSLIPKLGYRITPLYKECRNHFPELNSKVVQNFIRYGYTTQSRRHKPKKPVKASLFIDYQNFGLLEDSKTKLTSLWLRSFRRNFPLLGKYIFDRIEDFSDMKLIQIFERDNKLYCKLSYVKEIEDKPKSSKSKIVGLDLNAKQLVLSSNDFYSLKRLNHRKIEHHKNKKPLKNFTKDFAQKLSTKIALDLSNQGQEVLVLENLKNLRRSASKKLGTSKGKKVNYIVNSLPYNMFQSFLEYKCKSLGIRVEYIPPHFTSKLCSKCMSLETERPKLNEFICKNCGLHLHADLNGARNIASRYIQMQCAASESSALIGPLNR